MACRGTFWREGARRAESAAAGTSRGERARGALHAVFVLLGRERACLAHDLLGSAKQLLEEASASVTFLAPVASGTSMQLCRRVCLLHLHGEEQ